MLFMNISNHPVSRWDEKQKTAAIQMVADEEMGAVGQIIDLPFPVVPPAAKLADIEKMADNLVGQIKELLLPEAQAAAENHMCQTPVAHVMGEMGLTCALVQRLHALGLRVVHSTTERKVVEGDGGAKTAVFEFVAFRPYATTLQGRWNETAKKMAEETAANEAAEKAIAEKEAAIKAIKATIRIERPYGVDCYIWACPKCGQEIRQARYAPAGQIITPESNDGRRMRVDNRILHPLDWVVEAALAHQGACK